MVPSICSPPLYHEKLKPRQALDNYIPGHTYIETNSEYEYDDLKPHYPNVKWPTLKQVPYHDKGLLGDPYLRNLKEIATDIVDHIPKIGTEVHGVDLGGLSDDQKNDIARLVAIRGVVFFRNQTNFNVDEQRRLGAYFGTLYKHATAATPRCDDLDDVQVIWNGEDLQEQRSHYKPSSQWQSDATYEIQPPSYTTLKLLTAPTPGGGGDTLWSSQYAAYDSLSAPMQRYLCSLTALHSSSRQEADDNNDSQRRRRRRRPITTAHPLVRTHPVTGWKSLFFNHALVSAIIGVPRLESAAIIAYLTELIATTPEIQVRFQWRKDDVAFWDSRVVNHHPSYGFAPHRRHALHVACHGERPYLDPASLSQEESLVELYGIPLPDKDGSGASRVIDYDE